MLAKGYSENDIILMWYYAENNQQRGPVSAAEFEGLVQAGTITDETLVWREGMANWQAWREVKPAAGAAPIPSGTPAPFATRARTGGSGATEEEVRARDYEHDIGGYVGQAWELVKGDFGGVIGAVALVGLCLFAVNMIPYLSIITAIIFTGPLYGGLFAFFLRKARRQDAGVGDAFCGFGPQFGQLIAGNIIPGLLAALAFIPAGILFAIAVASGAFAHKNGAAEVASSGIVMVAIGAAVVGFCVAVYLQTCWVFTLWMVIDKKLTFWPAMQLSREVVGKHWWQTFLLGLVASLIGLAGILLCGIGLLVSAPVAIAMYAYAYEKLFGDLQSAG